MPPTLTSKNIFDVVFEQLPADAFIDTGPASLREELMLEAAGLSGGSSSNVHSNSNSGRSGSSQYRRHLLPSSVLAEVAKGGGATSMIDKASGNHTSVNDDVLEDGEAVDGEDGNGESAPPAYTSSSAGKQQVNSKESQPAGGHSLFRRVDDIDLTADFTPSSTLGAEGVHSHNTVKQSEGVEAPDKGSTVDFSMQMDEDDDAVKEATKYARLFAAAQSEGEGIQENGDSGVHVNDAVRTEGIAAENDTTTSDHGVRASSNNADGNTDAAAAATAPLSTAESQQESSAVSATATPSPDGGATNITAASVISNASTDTAGNITASLQPYGAILNSSGNMFTSTPAIRGGTLTAAEQLALMPPGLDRVYTGSCVMYRNPKGFGFLSPDIGGPDVYFINNGVALSFTRLALRAFYLRHGVPLPASVATVFHPAGPEMPGIQQRKETNVTTADTRDSAEGKCVKSSAGPAQEIDEGSENEESEEKNPTVHIRTTTPVAPTAIPTADEKTAEGTSTAEAHLTVQEGVLGDAAALAVSNNNHSGTSINNNGFADVANTALEDVGDRVSIPPTTEEELAHAEAAADLLNSATAALLQYQVDQGFGGGLRVGEKMSFVVTRNHAGRGGNGRLLRAEFIRGLPSAHYAMPVEQSWFAPLFPGAVGRKTNPHTVYTPNPADSAVSVLQANGHISTPPNGAPADAVEVATDGATATVPTTAAFLVRYTGCVRTYDPEDQRGYLRCDEIDATSGGNTNIPDVIFHGHAVLWDLVRCPPMKRQVKESMRVAYSVCGTERNGKYVATLITTPEGEPFAEENMTFAENVLPFYVTDSTNIGNSSNRRRGRGDISSGMGGNRLMGGVEGGMRNDAGEAGGDRKRAKAAEDDLLLFEEDDYPFM